MTKKRKIKGALCIRKRKLCLHFSYSKILTTSKPYKKLLVDFFILETKLFLQYDDYLTHLFYIDETVII